MNNFALLSYGSLAVTLRQPYGFDSTLKGKRYDVQRRLNYTDIDAEVFEFGSHANWDGTIGNDTVQFVDIRYMYITAFVEFG